MDLDFSQCKTKEDVEKIVRDSSLIEISKKVSAIGKIAMLYQIKKLNLNGST